MAETEINLPIASYDSLGGAIIDIETLNITPDGVVSTKLKRLDVDNAIAELNALVEQKQADLVASLALINNAGIPPANTTVANELTKIQNNIFDIQSAINQKGVQVASDEPLANYGNAIRQIVDKSGLHIVYWRSEPDNLTYLTPLSANTVRYNLLFNAGGIAIQSDKQIKLLNYNKTEEFLSHRTVADVIYGNTLSINIRSLPRGEYKLYLQIPEGFICDVDGRASEFFEIPIYVAILEAETCRVVIATTTNNQRIRLNMDSFTFMEDFDVNNSFIDWGDGSEIEPFEEFIHTYAAVGEYIIRIHGAYPHEVVTGLSSSDTAINGMINWKNLDIKIPYNDDDFLLDAFSVGSSYPSKKLETVRFSGISKITTERTDSSTILRTFANCTALTSVDLPDVKKIYISNSPPRNSSLTIELFTSCSKLRTIKMNNLEEFFAATVLNNSSSYSIYLTFLNGNDVTDLQLNNLKHIYFYQRAYSESIVRCSSSTIRFASGSVTNLNLPELLTVGFFKAGNYTPEAGFVCESTYSNYAFGATKGQTCNLPKLKHIDRINLPKDTKYDFIPAVAAYSGAFNSSPVTEFNLPNLETIQSCELDGLYYAQKTSFTSSTSYPIYPENRTFENCTNLIRLDLPKLRLISCIRTSSVKTNFFALKQRNYCFANLYNIQHLRLPKIEHIGDNTLEVCAGGVFTSFGKNTLSLYGVTPTLEFGEAGNSEPLDYAQIFGQGCFSKINTYASGSSSSSAVGSNYSWVINIIFNQPSTGENMTWMSSSYSTSPTTSHFALCWMPFIHIFINYEDRNKVVDGKWLGIQWGSITIMPPNSND